MANYLKLSFPAPPLSDPFALVFYGHPEFRIRVFAWIQIRSTSDRIRNPGDITTLKLLNIVKFLTFSCIEPVQNENYYFLAQSYFEIIQAREGLRCVASILVNFPSLTWLPIWLTHWLMTDLHTHLLLSACHVLEIRKHLNSLHGPLPLLALYLLLHPLPPQSSSSSSTGC